VTVTVERRGPVLVVTLDRPDKRNAVDAAMTAALSAAFDQFEDDPGLRVAILTANGTIFSAGTDLLTGPGELTARGGKYGLIRRRPVKPVIAAVQGPAIGGGFELVLACDLVVAAKDVFFALPETARARVANAGALFRAGARLPRNLATELLIAGGRLTAERGYHLGLVNRLADPGQALAGALELAQAICSGAPSSVEETMRAMRAVDAESELTGWQATAEADARQAASADRAEGLAAFQERRPPSWPAQAPGNGGGAAQGHSAGMSGGQDRQQRRGRSIAMTTAELDAFLGAERTCRAASISRGGRPHVSPLWFVWDGSALWLNSVVHSQRWRDLERNPSMAIVVDAGVEYGELRGVELAGRVRVMSEVPRTSAPLAAVADVERRYAGKYARTPDFVPDGRHAWLRLEPEKVVSWDFRKNSRLGRPAR
jgi:enoyl-CoA hydratase